MRIKKIEIVRDFDGSYYYNSLDNSGIELSLNLKELKKQIKEKYHQEFRMLNGEKSGRKTYYSLILGFPFDCFLILVNQKRFSEIKEIVKQKFGLDFEYKNLESPKENYNYIYNLIR